MVRCTTCGKAIRVPKDWTVGPAVRRHYWAKHPERMQRSSADQAATKSIPVPKRGSKR